MHGPLYSTCSSMVGDSQFMCLCENFPRPEIHTGYWSTSSTGCSVSLHSNVLKCAVAARALALCFDLTRGFKME